MPKFFPTRLPLHDLQNAFDHIAAVCHAYGMEEAVICPGSRNAPLTIAFVRSKLFRCLSVADERSAGFIALGKALASGKGVALICTSGSAMANFYPAILEAYYQKVPLLVITADRPPEWIDQWDGQTIRQQHLFGSHVRAYLETPDAYEDANVFARITETAVRKMTETIPGPVHMNVPIREPFYPDPERVFEVEVEVEAEIEAEVEVEAELPKVDLAGKKVLILRGFTASPSFVNPGNLALYEDIVSGGSNEHTISELLFYTKDEERLKAFRPDVLLTDGTAILSKSLKRYLRKYGPSAHFHFSEAGEIADPFLSQPHLVRLKLDDFLSSKSSEIDSAYGKHLLSESLKLRNHHLKIVNQDHWNEFSAIHMALSQIPEKAVLHTANSMAVRYVAYEEPARKGYRVFGNRGVSGIDGCVSTALGYQSNSEESNYLFVGDVAFFYDSNAFWNPIGKIPLKVILMNNGGGGIFRMIDGPAEQPEREEFLETAHHRDAGKLCGNLGVNYFRAENQEELLSGMRQLNQSGQAAVLEVFTNPEKNQEFFNQYKSIFNGI